MLPDVIDGPVGRPASSLVRDAQNTRPSNNAPRKARSVHGAGCSATWTGASSPCGASKLRGQCPAGDGDHQRPDAMQTLLAPVGAPRPERDCAEGAERRDGRDETDLPIRCAGANHPAHDLRQPDRERVEIRHHRRERNCQEHHVPVQDLARDQGSGMAPRAWSRAAASRSRSAATVAFSSAESHFAPAGRSVR
jgi:hypothetical protein